MTESLFPPYRAEALRRAAAIETKRYARTRNALDGDVTRLSPYITHGLISVKDVLIAIRAKQRIDWHDKIVFELGWREYFHHVWSRLGDAIWRSPHATPARQYLHALPADIRAAQTGVPIIDQQITALYKTGYVHNHARMWIAAYLVHFRKVDWRVGARWMYAHLLDGDLASNTLSWQWVAGTWTGKPYLFNAENVARYAPGIDCSTTIIDATYEALDALARGESLDTNRANAANFADTEPPVFSASPEPLASPVAAAKTAPRECTVVHPWSLHSPSTAPKIAVIVSGFHEAHPWSSRRWHFIADALRASCDLIVEGSLDELSAYFANSTVRVVTTLNPHYRTLIDKISPHADAPPRAFANPPTAKRSFSAFWSQVSRAPFDDLLIPAAQRELFSP